MSRLPRHRHRPRGLGPGRIGVLLVGAILGAWVAISPDQTATAAPVVDPNSIVNLDAGAVPSASVSTVNVSNPTELVAAGSLPTQEPNSTWFDGESRVLRICDNTGAEEADEASEYLPLYRWQDAMSLHTRLDSGKLGMGDLGERLVQNNLIKGSFATGNTLWSTSQSFIESAIAFCPLESFGGVADSMFATVGNTLLYDPVGATLTVGLIVASILVALFRLRRDGTSVQAFKTIFGKAVILALLAVMTYGATQSTGGTNDVDGRYKPGKFSPGWLAGTVDQTVANLAQVPSAAASTIASTTTSQLADGTGRGGMDCRDYVIAMREIYGSSFHTGEYSTSSQGSATAIEQQTQSAQNSQLVIPPAAQTPMLLSQLWENTAYKMWADTQLGKNRYADQTICRALEMQAGSSPASQALIFAQVAENGQPNPFANGQVVWSIGATGGATTEHKDRALVAWAACTWDASKGQFVIDSNRAFLIPNKSNPNDAHGQCQEVLIGGGSLSDNTGDYFDWGKGNDQIKVERKSGFETAINGGQLNDYEKNRLDQADSQPRGANASAYGYVNTLHGKSGGTAVPAFAFVISSLVIFITFTGFAAAIVVAKFMSVIVVALAGFLLVALLLPISQSGDRLKGMGKTYLGLSLFAFAAQAILALVVMFSAFFTSAIQAMTPNGVSGVVVSGFSPILAVIVLHLVCTRFFKMPSPFKPSTGLTLGKMAMSGALGGAAAGGVLAAAQNGSNALSKGESDLEKEAKRRGRGLLSRNGGKNVGSDEGDDQKMAPDATGSKPETDAEASGSGEASGGPRRSSIGRAAREGMQAGGVKGAIKAGGAAAGAGAMAAAGQAVSQGAGFVDRHKLAVGVAALGLGGAPALAAFGAFATRKLVAGKTREAMAERSAKAEMLRQRMDSVADDVHDSGEFVEVKVRAPEGAGSMEADPSLWWNDIEAPEPEEPNHPGGAWGDPGVGGQPPTPGGIGPAGGGERE